jgi:alkane 1-monooxygenase
MSPLPFLLILLFPASAVAGYLLGGMWTFLTLAFAFGLAPVLDLLVPKYRPITDSATEAALDRRVDFRLIMWLGVAVQVVLTVWGAYVVTHRRQSPVELVGFALAIGISNGSLGITVGHELIHRMNRWERSLGMTVLATTGYAHFAIEHIGGHHKWVATPKDNGTARLGQSFYSFWFRQIINQYRSAVHVENERLHRAGRKALDVHNRLIWWDAAELALIAALVAAFGPWVIVYFVAESFLAQTLLAVTTYIQHYGMQRKQVDGKYIRPGRMDAWDCSNRLSCWLLANLERHSDHHERVWRRYQNLQHSADAPQLPTGYNAMIILAFIPPVWRQVMDKRAMALRAND